MAIILAAATLARINSLLEADQGNSYRGWLKKVLPHIGDAYRQDESPFRKHLGASQIGKDCMRQIWYSWRWYTVKNSSGRMVRLFNTGHLMEGRIIALLLMIGMQVYQQDSNGKQFAFKESHFGGSGDGVGMGCPDLPFGIPCLLEFKTANEKSFNDMVKKGVRESKPEHYAQIQTYLKAMKLNVCLYIMVNKNNDELHIELVYLENEVAFMAFDRAKKIEESQVPPVRKWKSAGAFGCKFCDHHAVCHLGANPVVTCRSCAFVEAIKGGDWYCHRFARVLSFEDQQKACGEYSVNN